MFELKSGLLIALFMLNLCILIRAAPPYPPYQVLPPREGHVPVYIRHGDNEPLSNILPGLAEAFKEGTSRPALLNEENLIKGENAALVGAAEESDIASFDAIKAKDN